MSQERTILELEAETANETAKGACNLVWLRMNTFARSVERMAETYQHGKCVYDATTEQWSTDMSSVRHAFELLFQEFNRSQYYKNVAADAQSKADKVEAEMEEMAGEASKPSDEKEEDEEEQRAV